MYEIHKQSPDQCVTPIGAITGFEVKLVFNTWQPEKFGLNSCPNRQGVEGYFLLLEKPHLDHVPYMEFVEKSSAVIKDCKDEINRLYSRESLIPSEVSVRKSWDSWYNDYAPKSDSVIEYIQAVGNNPKAIQNPLGLRRAHNHIIWDSSVTVRNPPWKFNPNPKECIDPTFKYPAVLQAAMNSVHSTHMPHPNRPRFTAEQDASLLQFSLKFDGKATKFYDTMKKDKRIYKRDYLQELVTRNIDYTGIRLAISGTKEELVSKLINWNKSFLCTIFRNLLPEQSDFVDSKFDLPILSEADEKMLVTTSRDSPDGIRVTRKDFTSLKTLPTRPCFEAILDMFDFRDFRICSAYHDKYENTDGYSPRKRSKFLSFDFMESLMNAESADHFNIQSYFNNLDNDPISSYHRVYCLYEDEQERGDISLLFLDVNSKTIEMVNPRWGSNETIANHDLEVRIFEKFKSLAEKFRINFEHDGWKIRQYPLQFYDPIAFDRNTGTGIYIVTILYFLCINCPVFFEKEQIDISLNNFCLWLLNQSLPI